MDYQTATKFLIAQGTARITRKPDAFLMLLEQKKPPIAGQMTSILLALKVAFDALQAEEYLHRPLASALYLLSVESQQLFLEGLRAGVSWPPLLKEDIQRIDKGVRSILSGAWEE
ncbi:MAG: Dethiobiotin synthetase [Coleofasciculaceae cyanobacterium SM2_3_26]|nr:Dethiobiotin synthetase [Coleofasciculaceae cyanobacterium SM2_3_26]